MDGRPGRVRKRCFALGLTAGLTLAAAATPAPVPVDALPAPAAVLAEAGKRLSRDLSPGDLTALASRADRLLATLTAAERDALARGGLRFQVDRASDVFVAHARGSSPFWLADLGFVPAGFSLRDGDLTWDVARKRFEPGWVGLGVNGLDLRPAAHYAVFVRPADGVGLSVNGHAGYDWTQSIAVPGGPLEIGGTGRVDDLPPPLRDATLFRRPRDARHDTVLARGRAWKTHVVASRRPDQVTVAFGADPTRELVWSWRTSDDVGDSAVRLVAEGQEGTPTLISGKSERVETPSVLNDPVMRRHVARASGLTPGVAYRYEILSGADASGVVRTAPERGSDVAMLYMGDPQCGLEGWGKLLETARKARPDAGVLLIAGDLVDRGNERTNWDHFFLRAAGVFDGLPVMPAVGNHEYLDRGPWLYRTFFELPHNGPAGVDPDLVYHFEYGDAFVAVLDGTLAVSSPAMAEKQAEWLDRALAQTDRLWKLVMFHHPVYAAHPDRQYPALRDAWVPVLDKHHVDLVLQGHDHSYLRTYPFRENHRVGTPAEGTVYVVAVSGDKYCDQNGREYGEVGFTHVSTYQTLDLSARDRTLTYKAIDADGRVRDHFVLKKPSPSLTADASEVIHEFSVR